MVEEKMMMVVLTRTTTHPTISAIHSTTKWTTKQSCFTKIWGFPKGNQTLCWCNFWDNNN
jgi:hypothetical protein